MVAALAMMAGAVQAQRPQMRQGEPVPPAGRQAEDGRERAPRMMEQRRQEMREQVEERFGRMIKTELELSDNDMERVRQVLRANQDRRIALMRREQDLRRAIGSQLQPGQAANNDSLSRMIDAVGHIRVERAESDEQMMRELNFLPAVKRARLGMMMQRFEERVREVRQRAPMMRRQMR